MKNISCLLVLMTLAAGCQSLHAREALENEAAPEQKVTSRVGLDAPTAPVQDLPGAGEVPGAEESPDGASALGTVTGPPATGEGFSVHLETTDALKVGQAATLNAVLKAKEPFKCNDKYPYKFKFEPNAAVTPQSEVVRGVKIEGKQATLTTSITPKAVGKHTVAGELSFSVCTPDKCLVEKQRLTISFEVK